MEAMAAATYAAMTQPSMAGSMGHLHGSAGAYDVSRTHFGQPGDYAAGRQQPGGMPMGFNYMDIANASHGFPTMDSLMGQANQQKRATPGQQGQQQSQGQQQQQQPSADMANMANMLAMAAAASRPNASSPAITQQQLDNEQQQLISALFAQPGAGGSSAGAGHFAMAGAGNLSFNPSVDVNTLAALSAAYGQPQGANGGLPDGMADGGAGLNSLAAMSMGFRPMGNLGADAHAAAQFASAALHQQQGSAAAAAAMYAAIMAGNPIDQYGGGVRLPRSCVTLPRSRLCVSV